MIDDEVHMDMRYTTYESDIVIYRRKTLSHNIHMRDCGEIYV